MDKDMIECRDEKAACSESNADERTGAMRLCDEKKWDLRKIFFLYIYL